MENAQTGDLIGDKKTITSLMKPTSLMSGRLNPFFILMASVMLILSSLLIPLWIIKLQKIEREVDSINRNVSQRFMSEIKTITELLYNNPLNSTTTNLATILSSSIENHDVNSFSTIQTKVAPALFQALLTVPWLSRVFYAGLDGLFFSYYYMGDDRTTPFAVYSNSSNNLTCQTWYSQRVNLDSGKLYGDAIGISYNNVSWIQEAIVNNAKGYGSSGYIWNNQEEDHDDLLFMSIAGLKNRLGAVSLGFSVNSLTTNLLSGSGVDSNGGKLFLSTIDGRVLIQGIANSSLMVDASHDYSVLFVPNNGNRRNMINCGNEEEASLIIWGIEYAVYCSAIDIIGVKSVYAVLLPKKNEGFVHKNVELAMVTVISMIGAVMVLVIFFIVVMMKAGRREMFLSSSLIKQMEATQQAERKCVNKSLAFTSASHDIRASLAGLIGLIEFCRERASSGSELEMNLVQMETCAKDLLTILNSIMNISKIEAGKIELEEEVFSMGNLLEEVVDLYHPAGMKKGIDVILDPCDGSISRLQYLVKGDRTKLKQILWNLLNNAVKFTSEGHIVVRAWAKSPSLEEPDMFSSCTQTNSFCCFCVNIKDENENENDVGLQDSRLFRDPNCWEFVIEVEDTGQGIPKEKQKFVFENYVQVKETAVAHQGTGLGLGIVQSLVRIMGGEITIEDKDHANYESGTCFRFNTFMTLMPELEPEPVRGGPLSSSSPKLDQNSVVVLFIQSKQRQLVIEKFMTSMGIKVYSVKEWENFPHVVKKVKQKMMISHLTSSGRSEMSSRMDCMSSLSTKMKEFPLSSLMDGRDEPHTTLIPNFVLLVIDPSGGRFRDLSRAVAEFRRDIHESRCCTRIIWLDKPGESSIHLKGLDEDKLPSTDMIVYKPLHGSRLHNIIALLPEFGGSVQRNTNALGRAKGITEIQQKQEENDDKVLTGKRVLIVEDNGMLRMLAKNIVSSLGGMVEVCDNGEEAVELVCKRLLISDDQKLDYILMDCEVSSQILKYS
ncbi:histidine kinase CKI1 [Impatiens glandulifera]|uniref:histidine kinase CKI1 n=1 Tax=Impatiens glandulifera TaxID=253017 RepID=UPI001FB04F1C|nr:histidine kinase CKI1 [Impatiens glandulifera]